MNAWLHFWISHQISIVFLQPCEEGLHIKVIPNNKLKSTLKWAKHKKQEVTNKLSSVSTARAHRYYGPFAYAEKQVEILF